MVLDFKLQPSTFTSICTRVNLPLHAMSPLFFAFPVQISICCTAFCSLHLSLALSFYISSKVGPLMPTHAFYAINKSYWRLRKEEAGNNR